MRAPVPAESATIWTPTDFPIESTWSVDLTPADRTALVAAGRGDTAALADHFRDAAAHWTTVLQHGAGFLRLRSFPIDELSADEIERAYLALGTLLGTPVGQDRDANVLTHIRDEQLRPDPSVRKYRTNQRQDFHSDGSDLVGLLCLHLALAGGESKIVSAHAVYNEALRRAPHLVDVMYGPMPWDRNNEQPHGQPGFFELPPITDIDGIPRVFFIAWYIRDSQRHPDAPRLTDNQREALALFETIANDPDFHIQMTFEPGDVQLLNNATVLHSREQYTDHADPSQRRHLLRLWLTAPTASTHELLRQGIPRQ